jgi:DNA-binding IscR family transcriptional regulator
MVKAPGETFKVADFAKKYGWNHSQVGSVVTKLAAHGLVKSLAGRKGGISLGREVCEISVLDVFEAVEGTAPLRKTTGAVRWFCDTLEEEITFYLSDWNMQEFVVFHDRCAGN